MSFTDDLQAYSYESLLSQALARVPNTVDKREGSIIYDALAPACYVLAEFFMVLYRFTKETHALTATGEFLDNRCAEQGVSRRQSSHAVKKAVFKKSDGSPATASIGNRFSTLSDSVPLYYTITDVYTDESGSVVAGAYKATCETPGIEGQQYTGNIIPLDYLPQIAEAVLEDTLVPGANEETDDELRNRYFDTIRAKAFAGNIAYYREMVLDETEPAFSGIGDVQVYPVWNGGGTVKLSIIDRTLRAVSPEYIAEVQKVVDPIDFSGLGLGKAPIDHQVTITTPEEVALNISSKVTLLSGYSLASVQEEVTAALTNYLTKLRESWGESSDLNEYSLSVYNSQILRTILEVPGIANATDVVINGSNSDIEFTENAVTQQIPILGEVTLSA